MMDSDRASHEFDAGIQRFPPFQALCPIKCMPETSIVGSCKLKWSHQHEEPMGTTWTTPTWWMQATSTKHTGDIDMWDGMYASNQNDSFPSILHKLYQMFLAQNENWPKQKANFPTLPSSPGTKYQSKVAQSKTWASTCNQATEAWVGGVVPNQWENMEETRFSSDGNLNANIYIYIIYTHIYIYVCANVVLLEALLLVPSVLPKISQMF